MTTKTGTPVTTAKPGAPKRRYEKPRLVDYGHVTKLTLTGGITTRDTGTMKRQCL
jgi:hypothetical protein